MPRLARSLESAIERRVTSQIYPVIVEATKPDELFKYTLELLSPTLQGLRGLISRITSIPRLFAPDTESIFSMFYPRLIKKFNMFSILATLSMLEELAQSREVVKVYPNRIMKALELPKLTDAYYDEKRRLYYTTTYHVVRKIMGVEGVKYDGSRLPNSIAILDTTGVPQHYAIIHAKPDSVIPGIYTDSNGHGTWVAAAAAGKEWWSLNKLPTVGVAPGSKLVTTKCLGFITGIGSDSWIIEAIAKSAEVGAKVVNMSLGSDEVPESIEDDPQVKIIEDLSKQGMIFCVAAGNSGPYPETLCSPGIAESALTVGAYNPVTGTVSSFSSRGPTKDGRIKPDCVAPGENIFGPVVGLLDYAIYPRLYLRGSILSGTSMATPFVAGLVHLIAESAYLNGINITVETVKDVLRRYGEFPEKSTDYGWGLLSWDKWVMYAKEVLGISV